MQQAREAAKQTPGVDVSIDDGKVTLRGQVSSQQEKDDAENRVNQVPGVQSVKNDLNVNDNSNTSQPQPPTPQPQSNSCEPQSTQSQPQ